MPSDLYAFIAEELYQSVPEELRQQLLRLALAPELSQEAMSELLGDDGDRVIQQARDVGFLSTDQTPELHPRSAISYCKRSQMKRRGWYATP